MNFGSRSALVAFWRHFVPVAGFRLLALGLSFATNVLLARGLGPSAYGLYAFAIALFTIVQPIAGGGLGTLAVRELAQSKESTAKKQSLIRKYLSISFLLSVCVGFLAAVSGHFFELESSAILNLAVIVLPALVMLETLRGVLAGQHKVKTGQFLTEIMKPTLFFASLGILFWGITTAKSASSVVISFGLTSWLVVLVGLYLSPISLGNPITRKAFGRSSLAILRRSLPFAMITAMQYFNTRVDILLIGHFLTTADVGHYQVATKLASFVSTPASLVAVLLAPRFSAAYVEGNKDRLRRLYALGQAAAITLGIPVFLAFLLAGKTMIFWVYGAGYIAAVQPFLILAIMQMIFAARAASSQLLSMTIFEGKVMQALMVGVVGNIILNAVLIPHYGITGAASATAAMGVLTFIILSISLYRSGVLSRRAQR